MTFVMTSKRVPGGLDFCIGAIKIASIKFAGKNQAGLWFNPPDNEVGIFACDSVKDALILLHEKLNSPPPEGFNLPQFARKSNE